MPAVAANDQTFSQAEFADAVSAAPGSALPERFSPAQSVPALSTWLGSGEGGYEAITSEQRLALDELLSNTFSSVLRVEEQSLQNRITAGLTMTEIHAIAAIGLHESHSMSEVAQRLSVTLATLTTTMNKLVRKGLVARERSEEDRRRVMVRLTRRGREVCRAHSLFHRHMIKEALSTLTPEEAQVLAKALCKVKSFFDAQK